MRRYLRLCATGLVALLLATHAMADTGRHLMVGTWVLDLAKFARANPPKGVTITFEAVGADRYRMSVDIVGEDGTKSHGEATFKPDGTATPAAGSADVDIASMTMPTRRTLVMGAGYQGHPSNTRVFSISDDGRHMTETVVGHTANGTPNTQTNSWNRVR